MNRRSFLGLIGLAASAPAIKRIADVIAPSDGLIRLDVPPPRGSTLTIDATYEFAPSGANRFRDIYLSRNIHLPPDVHRDCRCTIYYPDVAS